MACQERYVNMTCIYDAMKKSKRLEESDSPLEALRIERTNLSQVEFAVKCGIPLRTYQRWVSGETESRPSLIQLKAMCRELGIERIDELPDTFGPPERSPNPDP